ncbi:hypothetical protein BKA93DRAFT_750246 [Sparassis latifolia]
MHTAARHPHLRAAPSTHRSGDADRGRITSCPRTPRDGAAEVRVPAVRVVPAERKSANRDWTGESSEQHRERGTEVSLVRSASPGTFSHANSQSLLVGLKGGFAPPGLACTVHTRLVCHCPVLALVQHYHGIDGVTGTEGPARTRRRRAGSAYACRPHHQTSFQSGTRGNSESWVTGDDCKRRGLGDPSMHRMTRRTHRPEHQRPPARGSSTTDVRREDSDRQRVRTWCHLLQGAGFEAPRFNGSAPRDGEGKGTVTSPQASLCLPEMSHVIHSMDRELLSLISEWGIVATACRHPLWGIRRLPSVYWVRRARMSVSLGAHYASFSHIQRAPADAAAGIADPAQTRGVLVIPSAVDGRAGAVGADPRTDGISSRDATGAHGMDENVAL